MFLVGFFYLNDGANTVSFFFKDAAGNVSTKTDLAITYNPPSIPQANFYLAMDDADIEGTFLRDITNHYILQEKNTTKVTPGYDGAVNESINFSLTGYYELWQQDVPITNALSFSSWVNIAKPSDVATLINQWDESDSENKYAIRVDTTGRLCLDYQTTSSTGTWNTSSYRRSCSTGKITFNTWVHLALIRDGATINFYQNATSIGTDTIDASNLQASTLPIRVGAQDRGRTNDGVSGYMDETAMWSSALTNSELQAVYAQGKRSAPLYSEMQKQASPIPDHYWTFDAADYSNPTLADKITASAIDVNNIASVTPSVAAANTGQVGDAFDFGNDHFFESQINHTLELGTEFAISAWFNIELEDDEGTIINKWNSADVDQQEFRLYTENRYVKFDYHATTTSGDTFPSMGFDTIVSSAQVSLNTWNHVAVTRKGNDLRMYINGVLVKG